jgi:hypothetical protein
VVKNGPTLTLIDKHATFLLTAGANLDCSNEVIVLFFVDCRAGSKYPTVDFGCTVSIESTVQKPNECELQEHVRMDLALKISMAGAVLDSWMRLSL